MKKIVKYVSAAVAIVFVCAVLFSFIGVGVFFLPLIGGVFTEK